MTTLRESIAGVRVIMVDSERELTLAWFGGHGIHAYNDAGVEVSFWNTGDFSKNDASERVYTRINGASHIRRI